ncbi:hypothetical protein XH89_15645 [Bradyrhizobium sp. CCBAU 53340]|uniref:DUF2285 domain-containing protein n=1 Tax=Bradyrhizobium sp. CCBAU 53340 TaxID=1325112 RepID=UPI00188DC57B|nr:DUF2285 domain-containing protein [Bradyrhizobium sp. CCBAU 53340]QOZ44747.1 hypothetical protein XH89_15645 [Bradyrhizobium sp. CCBAU 53340]
MNRSVNSKAGRDDDDVASCALAAYDGGDWAWEFLRRNADYVADWRCSVPRHLPCITLSDGTRLLRLRRRFLQAERWGLYAFADPRLCAHEATAFWHANALKRVVRLNARKPNDGEASVRRLADFNADRYAVIGADGIPLVVLKRNGVRVPLEIHGLPVLTTSFTPVYELHDLDDLTAQAELLRRLQRFADADFRAIQKPSAATDERLHQALIALDESLKGKTYRQIAIAIFGEEKVTKEWNGHSQFLRDRTRRLVAKGTELMKGGYRDLLS